MKRIHWHWTVTGHNPIGDQLEMLRRSYHFLIAYTPERGAFVIEGVHRPEANRSTSDGIYAAHTRKANTGAIGIAICSMIDAKDVPKLDPGPAPILEEQLDLLAELSADLCQTYNIPVTRETTLTHAEIEPTLGIKQRGKWDIRYLPGATKILGAIEAGDQIRQRVREAIGAPKPTPVAEAAKNNNVRAAGFLAALTPLSPVLGILTDMSWQQIIAIGGVSVLVLVVAGVVFREELRWMRQGRPEAE